METRGGGFAASRAHLIRAARASAAALSTPDP
jgi:hypothetical protein